MLGALERKSAREDERMLLSMASNPAVLQERTRVVSPTATEIRFAASTELMEKFERIKGLWAHALPGASWSELFDRMADLTLERIDPAAKAERVEKAQSNQTEKRLSVSHEAQTDRPVVRTRKNQAPRAKAVAKSAHDTEPHTLVHARTTTLNQRSVSDTHKVNDQPAPLIESSWSIQLDRSNQDVR